MSAPTSGSLLPESLREAALRLAALPEPISAADAQDFLEAFPVSLIVSTVQDQELSNTDLQIVCGALSRVSLTSAGTQLIAQNLELLSQALESRDYQIRRLAVQLLGSTLPDRPDSKIAEDVAHMLSDNDVGVASAAEQALVKAAQRGGPCIKLITSGVCGRELKMLTEQHVRAEVRLRALGLASRLSAISADAAAVVEDAGLLGSMATELRNPSDPLACAAALEVLQEVIESVSCTPGGSVAITEVFGPRLESLLRISQTANEVDPILVSQAFKVSGTLVASCAESGTRSTVTDSFFQIFLQSAAQIMSLRRLGNSDVPEEVLEAAMEAIATASNQMLGAEQVIRWQAADGSLVQLLALEAIGQKSGHGHERIVAIHALATLAGAERLGRASSAGSGEQYQGEVQLSAQAEDQLRLAVQKAAASDEPLDVWHSSTTLWSNIIWALLQQPFLELRLAVYRLCSALAVRGWAAADLCCNAELVAFVCNPASEAGQQASQWRFAMLQSLLVGATQQPAICATQHLLHAVDLGPYGTGRTGQSQDHIVATVPR